LYRVNQLDDEPVGPPPPRRSVGRPNIYDWSTVMDGDIWGALEGQDFTCQSDTFRNYLYAVARRAGMRVKTRTDGPEIRFQFLKGDYASS
jgi:hypothetical protein